MMPRRWGGLPALALVFLVCAYVAFVALMLPATLLDAALDARTAGRMRIAEAEGTIWAGRGRLEIRDPQGVEAIGTGVNWKWKPSPGAPTAVWLDFGAGQGAQAIFSLTSPADFRVSNLALEMPARILGVFVPAVRAAGLNGGLQIESGNLSFSSRGVVGTARVNWLDAGSTLVDLWPMGSYAAEIEVGLDNGKVGVRTLKGPLQLDGSLGWSNAARPDWQLRASVPTPFRSRLEPLMRMVGKKVGDGAYLIGPP